jgi:hypothetical protein
MAVHAAACDASTLNGRGPPAARTPLDPGLDSWWNAFDEPVLASLLRVAHVRASIAADSSPNGSDFREVEGRVAVAFIGIRTIEVRLLLVNDMRSTLLRKRQLLTSASPSRLVGQAVATLDERIAAATQFQTGFEADREFLVGAIAASTGMSNSLVHSVLAEGSQEPGGLSIPVFDVGKFSSIQTATTVPPLPSVAAVGARAIALRQSTRTLSLQAEVAARRWKSGTASEDDMLLADERLLVVEDMLSVVSGQLACAWIDSYLHYRSSSSNASMVPLRFDGAAPDAGSLP